MHLKKTRQLALGRLMLTGFLLLCCLILVVGTTWARYATSKSDVLNYVAREPDAVSLWAGYDTEYGVMTGDPVWEFNNGVGRLAGYVSNGTAQLSYAQEDVLVSVRLLGSLSVTDAQVVLSVMGESWVATPVQIQAGTPLYDTFGEGTVYVFLDEDGAELGWELEGGNLSFLPFQLEVTDLEQIGDAALLKLQIVGK